jgi:hypothetical protein
MGYKNRYWHGFTSAAIRFFLVALLSVLTLTVGSSVQARGLLAVKSLQTDMQLLEKAYSAYTNQQYLDATQYLYAYMQRPSSDYQRYPNSSHSSLIDQAYRESMVRVESTIEQGLASSELATASVMNLTANQPPPVWDRPSIVSSRSTQIGNTEAGSTSTSAGDRWTFSAQAGQGLRIDMLSNSLDTYLKLIYPNGTSVESDDDGNGRNARIEIGNLSQTGTYTIIASGYSGTMGSYVLSVEPYSGSGTSSGQSSSSSSSSGSTTATTATSSSGSTSAESTGAIVMYDGSPASNRRNVNATFCSGFETECNFANCPNRYKLLFGPYCRAGDYPYIEPGQYRVSLSGQGRVTAGATDYGSTQQLYAFAQVTDNMPFSYTFCWPGRAANGYGFETIVQSTGVNATIDRVRIEYLGDCQ